MTGVYGAQNYAPNTQPWHVSFDLPLSQQSGEISSTTHIDNYVRFYLSLFLRRIWPILEQVSILHLILKCCIVSYL